MSLEVGVGLEEVREVEKALEVDPAQTEMEASKKEETEEKLPFLNQSHQLLPRPMWIHGFCPTLGGVRLPYGRTTPGMSILLLTSSSRVPEEMKESKAVEAPAGAQHHRLLPPRHPEAGEVGRAAQVQIQEVLAGEIRDKPLGGTAKSQPVEEVGRVAG